MAESDPWARIFGYFTLFQSTLDAIRREQSRTADDIGILKTDIVNLRQDMQIRFERVDAQLRAITGAAAGDPSDRA